MKYRMQVTDVAGFMVGTLDLTADSDTQAVSRVRGVGLHGTIYREYQWNCWARVERI